MFSDEDLNFIYLREYCRLYFLKNPDDTTDEVLNLLSSKFQITTEEELNNLYVNIKKGKQYSYDNINLLNNYVNKLEDLKDNKNNKISITYPYIDENKNKKILWLIFEEDMRKYISNYNINSNSDKKAITQYFCDITFNCVPRSKHKYRLFVLLGYNILLNKSIICCMALITDEKTSTFLFLFNKLKKDYGFNPVIMTCDFQISLRTALKTIFSDIKLYPCYYHYIKNIRFNLLKYYKSVSENTEDEKEENKNKKYDLKKIKGKNKKNEEFFNLLCNFRILPFIKNEKENISYFIKLIKENYINNKKFNNLNKFFDYFELTWRKKFDLKEWNLYEISKKAIEKNLLDKLFFTNNIMESFNSRINHNIIKDKNNTINKFNNQINYIINLYKVSGKYIPPIFSKTKALAVYFTNDDNFNNTGTHIN